MSGAKTLPGVKLAENPVWFAMVPTQLQVQLFSRYTKSPDHSSALWQLLRGEERVH